MRFNVVLWIVQGLLSALFLLGDLASDDKADRLAHDIATRVRRMSDAEGFARESRANGFGNFL